VVGTPLQSSYYYYYYYYYYQPDIETSIRVGDCFALLVEFYYAQGVMKEAYRLIQMMRERRIILNPYLEQEVIEKVHAALGVPLVVDTAVEEEEEEVRRREAWWWW